MAVDHSEVAAPSFHDIGQILLRRWWLVALTALISVAGVLAYTSIQQERYRATTILFVDAPGDADSTSVIANTYSQLVDSEAVLTRAIELLQADLTTEELQPDVTAEIQPDTQLMRINVTAESEEQAALRANAVADAAIAWLDESEINAQNRSQLRVITRASSGTLVNGAPYARNGILALILGSIVGGGAAIFLEQTISRVRTPEDVQRATGLPVLSELPRVGRRNELAAIERPQSLLSREVRLLATRLGLLSDANAIGTLVVTSVGDDKRSSVVTANLAAAFALADQRVVLVDGYLEDPSQFEVFNMQRGHEGLFELLASPTPRPQNYLMNGKLASLRVLLPGVVPADVTIRDRVVNRESIRAVVASLHSMASIIVIDVPPVNSAPHALLLVAAADHALIVAPANRVTPAELTSAVESLRLTGADVLGVILHNAR